MRPTRPAIEDSHWRTTRLEVGTAVLLVSLITNLATGLEKPASRFVLDLTKPVPGETESMGVPGVVFGGVLSKGAPSYPPRYALPLAAEVVRLSPSRVGRSETYVVEVRLQNTGRSAYYLPVMQEQTNTHKPGNKRRRTFDFAIRFLSPKEGQKSKAIVAVTFGSDSVPGSLHRLEPGESLHVLLPGHISMLADEINANEVDLQVVCRESTLEDGRYHIKALSEELVSANAARLTLRENRR